MHDQHFCVAPPFFRQNYGRYDQAPRRDASGPDAAFMDLSAFGLAYAERPGF